MVIYRIPQSHVELFFSHTFGCQSLNEFSLEENGHHSDFVVTMLKEEIT